MTPRSGRYMISMGRKGSRNMHRARILTNIRGITVMKISSISSLMVVVVVESNRNISLTSDMEVDNKDSNKDLQTYSTTVMSSS